MANALRQKDLDTVGQVDGWLTIGEAGKLYDLARESTGPIVEIGSWQGRSTLALALGSKAGTRQQVYAIDPQIGVPVGDRATARGVCPGPNSSSPEVVRSNLDRAGINGEVKIVHAASHAVADQIPACGLLFIDGAHDYESVCSDFALYLPKVLPRGFVVIHDVTPGDPGVVQAFDEIIMTDLDHWRLVGRTDSAVVIQKAPSQRHTVCLGFPGRSFCWGAVQGTMQATCGLHHDVQVLNNGNGWDDFNFLWASALNLFEAGEITHFAMLHADVVPRYAGWLDILLNELDDLGADLVSVAIALKDQRGLTSCGVGDPAHRWGAFRRFTVRELANMPETFCLADTPHPDKILLHNTGCWVCDLRRPLFRAEKEDGSLRCFFDFPTQVARNAEGKWAAARESEDWFFSRQIHDLGARSFITRKVRLNHQGDANYPNYGEWGSYKDGDEDTASRWRGHEIAGER